MKIAVWIYFSAVLLTSSLSIFLLKVFEYILKDHFNGASLPNLTASLIEYRLFLFLLPIAFFILAIWICRRRETSDKSFPLIYAGLSTLTISVLFLIIAISLSLPFLQSIVKIDAETASKTRQ